MAWSNAVADQAKKEYVLGRGRLYFKRSGVTGAGYAHLGNAPSFTISGESETLEHYDRRSGVAQLDEEVVTEQTRGFTLTVDSITDENMALFLGGSSATHTQANTGVTDEAIAVKPGQYYQLGESVSNPGGVRNVTSVVIQDATDTTTYTVGDDFELDAALGLIYILPDGDINAAGETIHVDYTPASETRSRISSGSTLSVDGSLKFVADNPKGSNRDVYLPDVTLQPQGEMELIGEEWIQIELSGSINVPSTGEQAIYVDGRAAT